MKILHIAPIGHHSEGIGTVLASLCPIQAKIGNEVRIISIFENIIYDKLQVTTVKNRKQFEEYISSWRPDIAIFHSHFHFEYVSFSKVLISKKIPYCVQLHGALSIINYKKNHLVKMLLGKLMLNSILEKASSIIYLNAAEHKNSIVPKINPRSVIISNGCNRQKDVTLDKKVIGHVKIVFLGRISIVHKGLDYLLEALRLLDKEPNKDYHLYIYGNPVDDGVNYLKQSIVGVDNVSYEGGIYGAEKSQLLRDTDIFILTSRYEGMPMGVLEAWSFGIPCILTEGRNMTQPNEESKAYWKTKLTSKDIALTIKNAVNSYKSNPIIYRSAAIEESKKYEWGKIAQESVEIYKEIMNS